MIYSLALRINQIYIKSRRIFLKIIHPISLELIFIYNSFVSLRLKTDLLSKTSIEVFEK